MLSIRSWNKWVCTTQPRLTVSSSTEADEIRLGQPVGLAPHAAAHACAEGPKPEVEDGCSRRGSRQPRRARVARQRCRPARCARRSCSTADAQRAALLPTSSHLAPALTTAAAAPAAISTRPDVTPAISQPSPAIRSSPNTTSRPSRPQHGQWHQAGQLDERPQRPHPTCGRVGPAVVGFLGGPPELLWRAAEPGRAGLRLGTTRAAESTATRPPLGDLSSWRCHS